LEKKGYGGRQRGRDGKAIKAIKTGKAILIFSWAKSLFYFKSFKLVLAQWGYRNIICYCHLNEASEVNLTTSFVFPRRRNSMTVVFALG
jgi:hypothetical protein